MLPEEKARVKIDKQLRNAGWDIISRNEYLPNSTTAVKEALMVGNTESDYIKCWFSSSEGEQKDWRLIIMEKRSSAHTKAQRAGRERDGNRCQICGSNDHVEGHHILDHQFGGAADKENIVALCHKHHNDVHKGLIGLLKI